MQPPRPGRPSRSAGLRRRTTSASRATTCTAGRRAGFTPSAANRIAQPTGLGYSDVGLAPGAYFYKVTAEDAAGNIGPVSNTATATIVGRRRPEHTGKPDRERRSRPGGAQLARLDRQRRSHPLQRPSLDGRRVHPLDGESRRAAHRHELHRQRLGRDVLLQGDRRGRRRKPQRPLARGRGQRDSRRADGPRRRLRVRCRERDDCGRPVRKREQRHVDERHLGRRCSREVRQRALVQRDERARHRRRLEFARSHDRDDDRGLGEAGRRRRVRDRDREGAPRRSRLRPVQQLRLGPAAVAGHGRVGAHRRRHRGDPLGAWTHLAATFDGTTQRLYVNGAQVGTLASAGSILTSTSAAEDRRQLHLGRVVRRPDRRGPRLQPRSELDRDPGRHELLDHAARRRAADCARNAHRDRRPRPDRPELGRRHGQRRRLEIQRLPLDDGGFTPSAGNRIAQPTGTTYTDTGLSAGTYYYKVAAEDSAGNVGPVGNEASAAATSDTTPPTVSVTAPTAGSTVAATVNAHCERSGQRHSRRRPVQDRRREHRNARTRLRRTPHPGTPSRVGNGPHTITAVARDGAGNTTTSAGVSVTVLNTAPPGLNAAWAFDEVSGTTAADQSGKGNVGTVSNTAWVAGGKYNNALSFSGSNAWVTVPDSATLDLTTGMTVEAWLRPTTVERLAHGGREGAAGQPRLRDLREQREAIGLPAEVFVGGSTRSVQGTAALPTLTWSHVAATYDGSTLRLYVNGAQVGSLAASGTILTSNSAFRIGGNSIWGEYFNGLIDEVRVYNRALTAGEIQADMNRSITPDVTAPHDHGEVAGPEFGRRERRHLGHRDVQRVDECGQHQRLDVPAQGLRRTPSFRQRSRTTRRRTRRRSRRRSPCSTGPPTRSRSRAAPEASPISPATRSPPTRAGRSRRRPRRRRSSSSVRSRIRSPRTWARSFAPRASTRSRRSTSRSSPPQCCRSSMSSSSANTALNAAQVTALSNWVTAGGNLIAMRPDKQLAGLLGLTDAGTTLANAYLQVDTSGGRRRGHRGQHDPVPRHCRPLHAERRDVGRDAVLERDHGDGQPGRHAAHGRKRAAARPRRSRTTSPVPSSTRARGTRPGPARSETASPGSGPTISSSVRRPATSSRTGSTRTRSRSRRPTSSSGCWRT